MTIHAFRERLLPTSILVAGSAWLLVALPPSLAMTYAQLGRWIGLFLELGGIILIGTAVACDLMRGAQSRPLAGDLRVVEIVAQEEEFLGARLLRADGLLAAATPADGQFNQLSAAA